MIIDKRCYEMILELTERVKVLGDALKDNAQDHQPSKDSCEFDGSDGGGS